MSQPPPSSTLFPYTTLFRSDHGATYRTGLVSGCFPSRENRVTRTVLRPFWRRAGQTCPTFVRPRVYLGRLRSEEHTSELQSRFDLVCRLLLEKKNILKYVYS